MPHRGRPSGRRERRAISCLTRGKAKTDHDQGNEKDANQRVESEIDYPVQALVKSEPDKDQNQDYGNNGEGDDGEMWHYGSSECRLHEHWSPVEAYQGGSLAIRNNTCIQSTRVWEKWLRLGEVASNINNY